jgi:hypothetical protein
MQACCDVSLSRLVLYAYLPLGWTAEDLPKRAKSRILLWPPGNPPRIIAILCPQHLEFVEGILSALRHVSQIGSRGVCVCGIHGQC